MVHYSTFQYEHGKKFITMDYTSGFLISAKMINHGMGISRGAEWRKVNSAHSSAEKKLYQNCGLGF